MEKHEQEHGQQNFYGKEALNGLFIGILMLVLTVVICTWFFNFQIFP